VCSVQYMQRPEEVFAEIYRVLKPGGMCIMAFSNRMFPNKAIAAWRDSSDREHCLLVQSYFQAIDGFSDPELVTQVCVQPPLVDLLLWTCRLVCSISSVVLLEDTHLQYPDEF
jgi:SAM-dependent methyltransferase